MTGTLCVLIPSLGCVAAVIRILRRELRISAHAFSFGTRARNMLSFFPGAGEGLLAHREMKKQHWRAQSFELPAPDKIRSGLAANMRNATCASLTLAPMLVPNRVG